MGNGLHIKIIRSNPDLNRFDASFGSLLLPKAGSFVVTVKEYEERKKLIDSKHDKDEEIARNKWNERAKAGWSKAKLEENWKANEAERNATKKTTQGVLEADFKEVNWVWTVAPKKIRASELSHNDSFNKGISGSGNYSINFPKILEGGGMAYLEAFLPKDGAKGAKPHGIFVQATGTPRIVRVEWTDFEYNILKNKLVAFNSEVLLHVYTEALYGQELEIKLFDEDIFKDDKLSIGNGTAFQREVNIHKVHPKEIGKPGVDDTLVKADQDKTDNKIEKEHYLQKTTIEIKVDPAWMKAAGEHLKIYPTVKSLKTGKYFENFSRDFLEVCSIDGILYDVPKEVTNTPVVQSEIETNVGAYHPCQYTEIDYINDEGGKIDLFTENEGVSQNSNLQVNVIAGADPKKNKFKLDDKANTDECLFHNKINDHKNILSYDKTKLPVGIKVSDHQAKIIEIETFFDYSINKLNYIWPTKPISGKLPQFFLQAKTCRHNHGITLTVYPDIRWELAFLFALKNPLAYTYSAGKDNKAKDKDVKAELIYQEAHKKAFNSGNDRNLLRRGKSIDSEFFVSLKAKWDKVKNSVPERYAKEDEFGHKWAQKISDFLDILIKLKKLAQDVKDSAGGAARKPSTTLGSVVNDNPFSFEIMSPKIGAVIQWQAEEINNQEYKNAIANTGTLKFVADPLIGAEFTINMLAIASKMHPVVYTIKKGLDIALDAMGGYMKLDVIFYGELKITIESLKLNSLEGVKITDKPPKIDGKMGLKVVFVLHAEGKISAFGIMTEIEFKADAKVEADAYFGGTALIKADKAGIYADVLGAFSGLIFTLKIDVKVGKFFKKIKIESDPIFPSDKIPLGKYYLT